MICADTTFLIDAFKGNLKAVEKCASGDYCTTLPSVYEFMGGIYYANNKKLEEDALKFISTFEILESNDQCMLRAAKIQALLITQGKSIGDIDIMIAGIALYNGCNSILTRNVKHFDRIPKLKVQIY